MCQKSYDKKILGAARKELKKLINFRDDYIHTIKGKRCEEIFAKLSDAKKQYVDPVEWTDEEYIRQWLKAEYKRKGFRENAPEYYTDSGERVRSKSEVLIAHALMKHKVPYRYEYPLLLNGYGYVYPDFTVLNVRTRKELYFEHLGMMDDAEYSKKALQKIILYEKNGIFPGDKLVLTYETSENPLDIRLLDTIIEHYFK